MRCAFGAVRVGALLGRVRLHLQTDRFLAVHRGDELWEEACREAGMALAEVVSRMAEREMDAALALQHKQHSQDEPPTCSGGLQPGMFLSPVGDDHSGTGKNACATDAALRGGATSVVAAKRSMP
jgi:hypothetical protein